MGRLPIQKRFGSSVTGDIGEEIGFGFQASGRGVQGLMPIGCPAVGNQEDEVGSGSQDAGNIVNSSELRVRSSEKNKKKIS